MTTNGLKMYSATYDTKYHNSGHLDHHKYIAATSFDAAINIALEILWNEFGKVPTDESPSGVKYEMTKAFVPPDEGIASITIWNITKWGKHPGWTTTLEMVAPQPCEIVHLSATETDLFPLQYTPGKRNKEDEERIRFMAIMRGERPWIEPEEPGRQYSQQNLLEVNQQEQPA